MSDELLVLLEDRFAGRLIRTRGGRSRFEYDPEYQQLTSATPLSLSMPIAFAAYDDAVVSPWLWGLLPDNEAVLRRWARDFQVSASSAFSLLSSPVGEDCAGAVRFVGPERLDEALTRGGEVTWLTDAEVGRRLEDLVEDSTAWLGRSSTGQFSLAGAQSKTALLRGHHRWGTPHGSIATSHILKPAIVGLDDHDLNEHLCLAAARRLGLPTARSTIASFGGRTAVVIERYDRVCDADGVVTRVHQEDLCQALGLGPDRKYQRDGGPAIGQIARLLREVMPASGALDAVRRFADALIFNWLIGGTDAHAKNYSLLLSGDQVRLAPLYDLGSALPYGMDAHRLRFAMKLGSNYDVLPYRDPWADAAVDLGLPGDAVHDRVVTLARELPDALAAAAAEDTVRSLDRPLPDRLLSTVTARVKWCLTLLGP